jgi:hypothetical protein
MLLLVSLWAEQEDFPVGVLEQCDALLAEVGFKKEVHSVVKPGKEFSATYTGPTVEKGHIEELLTSLAHKNHINFSIELEESVRFP